jgi:hypothetical protein
VDEDELLQEPTPGMKHSNLERLQVQNSREGPPRKSHGDRSRFHRRSMPGRLLLSTSLTYSIQLTP